MSNFNFLPNKAFQINELKFSIDKYCLIVLQKIINEDFKSEITNALAGLQKSGYTNQIVKLSDLLNSRNLQDNISQLLLSQQEIYALLISRVIWTSQPRTYAVNPQSQKIINDIAGLSSGIERLIQGERGFKTYFIARLISEVFDVMGYRVDNSHQWELLDDFSLATEISIRDGDVVPAVRGIFDKVNRYGSLMYSLNNFVESSRNAIGKDRFSFATKLSIVDYFLENGYRLNDEIDVKNSSSYDSLFLQAYDAIAKRGKVADDPINLQANGSGFNWTFDNIDAFDSSRESQIIPPNIRAAGALDYVYYIGEMMRVFDVANCLVLRWAKGSLDIVDGGTAKALYNYHKLRNQRNTPEERAMLYRRVLNKGDGKILSGMVVNEAFPSLWHQLMTEITEYIGKTESKGSNSASISRTSIFQAAKNLQNNLSEYMTGMAHAHVAEDYANLKDAFVIINAKDITENFGGRRKSGWSAIEQVAKEDLGVALSTSNIRTLGVEGNKIFQWLANFDEGKIQENEFQQLLKSTEAWIIAQASLDSSSGSEPAKQPSKQPDPSLMPDISSLINSPFSGQKGNDFSDW